MKSLIGYKVRGTELASQVFNKTAGIESCRSLIEEQTEGMSRDEVVAYATDLLFGILCIKQDIIDAKLFGEKR